MSLSYHMKLFIDAGITSRSRQEKYTRYLGGAISQEGIKVDDIIGVGEANYSFYVVTRLAVMSVHESGMFKKKRIDVNQVASIGSIAKLATRNEIPSAAAVKFEGRSARCLLTGWDSKGQVVLEIVWDGSKSPEITQQRDHLFKVIGGAMNDVPDAPARPPFSSAGSKAAYLREWAADVVKASGVEVTPERVEEHANIIAGGIRFEVFPKLAAPDGIDDLAKLYPGGEMPPGTIIETFDDLYGNVVAVVGDARLVDQEIDLLLARCWGEFVNGCRDTYANIPDAPARPSVSSAASKAGALREWAADVVKASGVEVTPERVEERADIMAAMIGIFGFPKLVAPYGIDDLDKLYPGGEMPPGNPIETFDDIYGHVVALVGDARPVDQEIDFALAKSWDAHISECRKNYA